MKKNRKHRFIFFLSTAVLIMISSCGRSPAHCFLCQSIPRNTPCIVNLSTGDVTELSVGSLGSISWSFIGKAVITGNGDNSCTATLPANIGKMNSNLFCENCQNLVAEVSDRGYVLADLHNLNNIQLYAIEDGVSITIREYVVSIEAPNDMYWEILEVTN